MDRKIYNPTNIPLDNIDIDQQDRIRKSNTYNRENIAYFDDELFLPYPDNPDYMIGNKGTIYNTKSGNLVKQYIGQKGYVYAGLNYDGKNHGRSCSQRVHRLVYGVFGEKPLNSSIQIDHIDTDKTNNRIENLEAVTCKENVHRAIENGIRSKPSYVNRSKQVFTDHFIMRFSKALNSNPNLSVLDVIKLLNLTPILESEFLELGNRIRQNNNYTNYDYSLDKPINSNSGQNNYNSKYSDEFIDQLCQLMVSNPKITYKQILQHFGLPEEDGVRISRLCSDIKIGKIWKHISSRYGYYCSIDR